MKIRHRQRARTKAVDPEKLLVKVSLGKKLSEKELSAVEEALSRIDLKQLSKAGVMDEAYALIHLVSKAKLQQLAFMLEPYLEAKDAPIVSLVLETLCLEWGTSEAYIERVIDFALGASWDEEEDVRQSAIKILGEYLHTKLQEKQLGEKPKRVLELILSIFAQPEDDPFIRQRAYSALCRAGGKSEDELPSEFVMLDLSDDSSDVDWNMLEKLRDVSRSAPIESSPAPQLRPV